MYRSRESTATASSCLRFPDPEIYLSTTTRLAHQVFGDTANVATTPHHVGYKEVEAFINFLKSAWSTEIMTGAELADAAQQYLVHRGAETAATQSTNHPSPPTIRILGARPNEQAEEDSMWHVPSAGGNGDVSPAKEGEKIAVHVSFWLLVGSMPSGRCQALLNNCGSYRYVAAAPYLSVHYCEEPGCSHRGTNCHAMRVVLATGHTSLYNRYLLAERAAYFKDDLGLATNGNVAHYAVVIG
ncbi:hypothetical protein GQ53DRAFT_102501 [Thozetella sp. PMI_491]|nr:hypothetical protein GQ53DRAFT_102501 [Thozetella sp. PMI_491]